MADGQAQGDRSYSPGDLIRLGDQEYVVLRPIEDYTGYFEGDTPGINDKPVQRKHLPVVRLPEVPQFIDESCFRSLLKEAADG